MAESSTNTSDQERFKTADSNFCGYEPRQHVRLFREEEVRRMRKEVAALKSDIAQQMTELKSQMAKEMEEMKAQMASAMVKEGLVKKEKQRMEDRDDNAITLGNPAKRGAQEEERKSYVAENELHKDT